MKIWIGCDHAGFDRKQEVIALLRERGLEVEDCGCNGERADYPVIAKAVGTAVASHPDANVMCMGARTLGSGLALELVEIFLDTPFEGGRHAARVDMIQKLEQEW